MVNVYDIAISYSSKDREYVEQVVSELKKVGINTFYDKDCEHDLWGEELKSYLTEVYQDKTKYVMVFISKHYAESIWSIHEFRSALAGETKKAGKYILPVRLDDTKLLGLIETICFKDFSKTSPVELAETVRRILIDSKEGYKPELAKLSANCVTRTLQTKIKVGVSNESGQNISEVEICMVAPNGTYLTQHTNSDGVAFFDIHKLFKYTIFFAHKDYPAFILKDFIPDNDRNIKFSVSPNDLGSLISHGGWNNIPGLKGQFNPIHDSLDRLYVYTQNIAVDRHTRGAKHFEIGKSLHFEDAEGNKCLVKFVYVIENCFLIEYQFY